MAQIGKRWRVYPPQYSLSLELGREIGVSPVVAQVLINRGICDADAAQRFLQAGTDVIGDPWLMKDMDRAVERVKSAIAGQEKIVVYGDYDVDGITATALMYRVLSRLGAMVEYYIPERQTEGYGLNDAALEALYQAGAKLIITVDCGISAVAEVTGMADRLDIIITDHHQPPESLPPAHSVINPKQQGCPYPDKQLAGVGVAFKLCQALWQRLGPGDDAIADYLDLVALGTIADIVPLTGENRVLVKQGLARLAATQVTGLKALVRASGLQPGNIDAGKVGFVLAPRLNAAGRLSHAAAGVELLVSSDPDRTAELAAELNNENSKRQAVEKELLAMAEKILAESDLAGQKVLVLAGEDWHPGVIGIVASRLVEKYYRPVVMISIRDGIGKGSCRSIPGFDIYQALSCCADLLTQFGGHRQAAGLSIDAAQIVSLRQRLNALAGEWLTEEDYQPVLAIDSELALAEIDSGFIEQLACLAPHGMGNPSPVFACDALAVTDMKPLGQEGRHFRLRVKQKAATGEVLAWNLSGMAEDLEVNDSIDLAFVPEFNEWQGRRSVQLRARDVRPKRTPPAGLGLIDARDTADRAAYILDLAAAGEKVLVRVNDRRSAVLLARRLRQQERLACKVAFHHSRQLPVVVGKVLDSWREGTHKILICAGSMAVDQAGDGHFVLYQPPLTRADFAGFCRLAAGCTGNCSLHFLYSRVEANPSLQIAAIFPDRAMVGRVYLILKGLAATSGSIVIADACLAARVSRSYGVELGEDGAAAAVQVLGEIDLVEQSSRSRRRVVYLKPEPTEKENIERSGAYRQCTLAREDFSRWNRDLGKLNVITLWKRAAESSCWEENDGSQS